MTDTVTQLHPEPTFETFWKCFPKKLDKLMCRAKWDAITGPGLSTRMLDRDSGQYVAVTLRATPEEIVAGAKRYVSQFVDASNYKSDFTYCCHPSTFLNRGR